MESTFIMLSIVDKLRKLQSTLSISSRALVDSTTLFKHRARQLWLRPAILMFLVFLGGSFCRLEAQLFPCHIKAKDAYGKPVTGVSVTLAGYKYLYGPSEPEAVNLITFKRISTDANGDAFLSLPSDYYDYANCFSYSPDSTYTPVTAELDFTFTDYSAGASGELILIPKPTQTIHLSYGGGDADLYTSGSYDKPVVIAQPFDSDEPTKGRKTPFQLWNQYNGNPTLLSEGLLQALFREQYDVWLVRPNSTGDNIHLQAVNLAQAIQYASKFAPYDGKVSVGGYSMGGLIVRTALSRWGWDASWRNAFTPPLDSTPPVNLIALLDSPLRGALVSNDLQHAMWNATFNDGAAAKDHNMDSCAAQQMLENGCHKPVTCPDCLECNDRGWYETFYGGYTFSYCNPAGSGQCSADKIHTCANPGVGILNQPNAGWPTGIKKIGASMGKFYERTGVCYGDNDPLLRDLRGNLTDGCPGVDTDTFDIGTEWGYLDITFSTDRHFHYQGLDVQSDASRLHHIDELTPGSRQPAGVQDIVMSFVNPHPIRHAGTFIPLYSALDMDPTTGVIPFDEYWTNSYSAFHDALADKTPGTWVNQRTWLSGSLSMPQWLLKNLADAFIPTTFALSVGKTGTGTGSVVSSPAGISCGGSCSSSFAAGTVVTLTASAGTGSTFAGWSGAGCSGTGTCTVTVNAAQSVTATFNAATSGSCGEASCVPAQGAYISHFTGSGCTGTESYYLPYDGYAYSCRTWDGAGQCGTIHRTVTNVSYKYNGACTNAWPSGNTLSDFVTVYRGSSGPVSFALSVGRAGTGTGTVVSSPAGISCGGTCSSSFAAGTVVTLTATAGTGSTFAGWSGAGCSGTGSCTVTVNAAQSVTATFNVATSGGCGEASCVPAQAAYISHFTGAGCTGTESYYLPYDGYAYSCRTWNGTGQCGTIHRTVTNRSYKYNGVCSDAWPSGNTLSDFVTVYR
jgi:Divergent InlB B-repeat domain